MRLYFQHPALDGQLLRLMGHIYYGNADLGECLTTAAAIDEGNLDSWHHEWSLLGDRIMEEGKKSEEGKSEGNGQSISARESYLRASNYYRAALAFLYQTPVEERLLETYHKHVAAFAKAARLFSPAFEEISIPYKETHLPGYFYKVDDSGQPRPTIIISSGYDSTHQEAFFHLVPGALRRGYNVLAFDGPGQGALLLLEGIRMRHEWEKVITPVVDYLYARKEVEKEKIALYGPSWGGMLAPRAAAYEKRINALIVNPGQYDALMVFRQAIDGSVQQEREIAESIDALLQAAMSDRFVAAKFKAKMLVHGVESPHQLFEEWQKYNLSEAAPLIECPTLVAYSENESLSPGQAELFFDTLRCPKEYHLFTNASGAGEHCAAGASGLMASTFFDWLDDCFSYQKTTL